MCMRTLLRHNSGQDASTTHSNKENYVNKNVTAGILKQFTFKYSRLS